MSNKYVISNFGKVLLKFASAQVISNFLRLLSGFLVVRFIEPELYGYYTGVAVYTGYILLSHGGIINGLSRELPFYFGKKNDTYAKELASSVYVLSIIICCIASLIFLIFGIIHYKDGEELIAIIYFSYSVIGGLHLLNKQFLPVLYRTNKDFNYLSEQNIKIGFSNLILVILVFYFNIYGLIARGILLSLLEFFLLYKNKPYKLPLSYHFEHLKKLLKTGFPIFLVGQVGPLWNTLINNFIFSIGGALNFGLYALSNIIQGAVGVIPTSYSQIIYARMNIMLGEGRSIKFILNSNIKPLIFQFFIILLISIVGTYALPIIIPVILPKYVEGIKAAQWMLFVPVIQSFSALNNIYNVVKSQKWYLFSLVLGAIIGTLYIYLSIKNADFKLEYFPQGIIIGTFIQQTLSLLFLSKLKNND